MKEFRIAITAAEHGRREVAEENMERLLEAFESTHPEAGAVIGADHNMGSVDATFSICADDANAALDIAAEVFTDAANASGLPATEIIRVDLVLVEASERELASDPNLQPA